MLLINVGQNNNNIIITIKKFLCFKIKFSRWFEFNNENNNFYVRSGNFNKSFNFIFQKQLYYLLNKKISLDKFCTEICIKKCNTDSSNMHQKFLEKSFNSIFQKLLQHFTILWTKLTLDQNCTDFNIKIQFEIIKYEWTVSRK